MTDKQKLQQLFDAALKSPVEAPGVPPRRVVPVPALDVVPAVAPVERAVIPAAPVSSLPVEVEPVTAKAPTMAGVLDDAASDELALLLDEQMQRKSRKRKIEALVTALVLLGTVGGASGWFVSSPTRVQAFKEAMRDIRSVGDVKGMVAKYQEHLDRIAARGKQIDQASVGLGVDLAKVDQSDAYMDAEMKEMRGGEGKTVGQRGKAMNAAFSGMAEKNGGTLKSDVALKNEESFDLK